MAMQLILARHGNTFGPGDKVVWVGARSDMPLVEKGLQQAEAVAAGLKAAGLIPSRIYAGPLKRTAETAAIVARECGLPSESIVIADELREIDYGTWEARSNDEIRGEVGGGPIDGWQKLSIWPEGFGWKPGESDVTAAWNRLIEAIRRDNADDAVLLIVSSNGIYRLVAKMLGLPSAEAKMGTGTVSRLVVDGSSVQIAGWNLDPSKLAEGPA
ncbi:histidine phosphatase family protein [Singulisphaera sp. PoT]|uniref:histidine phosphatase family protein n=1 Tax=Singulisphaera sp. PoT TaxID=3411797 RepID=UPI003BF5DF77